MTTPGALTKIKICTQWGDEIFGILLGCGVKVHRNGAQVKNKVEQIEAQFKSAYKWSQEETGQGLQLQDLENGTTTIKQAVSFCVANVIYVRSITFRAGASCLILGLTGSNFFCKSCQNNRRRRSDCKEK
jgi:(p)ppGpp synthase/HD superfamily hydrolase